MEVFTGGGRSGNYGDSCCLSHCLFAAGDNGLRLENHSVRDGLSIDGWFGHVLLGLGLERTKTVGESTKEDLWEI